MKVNLRVEIILCQGLSAGFSELRVNERLLAWWCLSSLSLRPAVHYLFVGNAKNFREVTPPLLRIVAVPSHCLFHPFIQTNSLAPANSL